MCVCVRVRARFVLFCFFLKDFVEPEEQSKEIYLDRFRSVSLFSGISHFMCYLMPKLYFKKTVLELFNQYLRDEEILNFREGISPKVN